MGSTNNGLKILDRDFPGGPVVKTLHFQCREHGSNLQPKIFLKNEKKTLHNLWLVASANAEPQCQRGGRVTVGDLCICRFLVSVGILEPIPLGY